MAIRKDLDDMLNSLKKGSSRSVPGKSGGSQAPQHNQRKSIYDSMSVDDLLHALNDEKKDEPAGETSAVHEEKPVTFSEEINVIRSSVPAEEKAPAPAEAPVQKKKKRIVITGELPDYEAIRQRELEKDRLAKEAAEKAEREEQERLAKEAAEKAEREEQERLAREAAEKAEREEQERLAREAAEKAEREEQERLAREAAEKAEREEQERLAREAAEKAEREEQERLAREAAEKAEREEQERLAREAAEKAEREEQERLAREAAEKAEREEQERLAREAAEAAEAAVQEVSDDHSPSADELLDAALAAIRNTTALAEEIEENTVAADDTDDAEPIYGEDEDPVSSMIEGMREDTANAIADLEKSSEEDEEASDEEEDTPEQAEETPAEETQEPVKEEKKNVLERILEEDPDELLNERSVSSEEGADDETVRKAGFKRKLYTILGAVFAVFAVIGMITVGVKCVRGIKAFTSGEVKKDGFTEVLYPAVIMDIDQFSDPSELSSEQMITASIWSIIMDSSRVSKYNVDPGTDTISIPYMDVEARAVEMFGKNHPEFTHCTVGPVDSRFFYSDGAYNVKPKTISYTYSPEIKSIVKSGSSYTVSVDYVDELPEWMEKSVSKSVEFKLTEREDGTYTIDSMKINYVKSSGV